MSPTNDRRLPVGAEPIASGGVSFRVWAPLRDRVEVLLEDGESGATAAELEAEGNGYFSGAVEAARPGSRYRFRLDGGDAFPDPVSRFQPEGPHGPSQVVDPASFAWSDDAWPGVELEGQAIYEMHVGTFTRAGTWTAAVDCLADLKEMGITVIEIMPVADFDGEFGWGYDGVNLFAPTRLYGTPDDFRTFVDRAHALGLGVILDVVYNHFGPSGNYLGLFSDTYITHEKDNEWGDALNFDGPGSEAVREHFITNATYWIDEFHLDGLRLDATQQILDDSDDHILAAIQRAARKAAGERHIMLVAEDEAQRTWLVRSEREEGYALDGLWNDDFHHASVVALTGQREAYYTDYLGSARELLAAARYGYLYQGQYYTWQKKPRGTDTWGLPPHVFVNYLENHDQVANSATGRRLHQMTSPARYRAMTAFLILGPWTPLLFQGQEFASSAPFMFFADHEPDLAKAVRRGRGEFLSQFPSIARPEAQRRLPDPGDRRTFEMCKLDDDERRGPTAARELHRDLLRIRSSDPVLSECTRMRMEGAVLSDEAFVLRYFAPSGEQRLLAVNLGKDLRLAPIPEPLLAPPRGSRWNPVWQSTAARYGGVERPAGEYASGWYAPAESAILFAPGGIRVPSEGNPDLSTGAA